MILLGMHRSGTSLLSNILHYLGCDMADTSDAISEKNPGGFWERPEIVSLHDEILEIIDRKIGSPQHLLPFPTGWWRRKDVQVVKKKLVAHVAASLSESTELWGFKDPRTCRLLPLWKEILAAVDAEPVYVHAIRQPVSAARSMALKNPKARPLSVAETELMWLIYNYDIVRHTAGRNSLIVDYDDWFANSSIVVEQLVAHLDLPEGLNAREAAAMVAELVTPDYRHHVAATAGGNHTIAGAFYDALFASRGSGASRAVSGQLPFIELLFQSIEPLIEQLKDLPSLRESAQDSARKSSEIAGQQTKIAELEALLRVSLETQEALRSNARQLDDDAKHAAVEAELRILQAEHRADLEAHEQQQQAARKTHALALDEAAAAHDRDRDQAREREDALRREVDEAHRVRDLAVDERERLRRALDRQLSHGAAQGRNRRRQLGRLIAVLRAERQEAAAAQAMSRRQLLTINTSEQELATLRGRLAASRDALLARDVVIDELREKIGLLTLPSLSPTTEMTTDRPRTLAMLDDATAVSVEAGVGDDGICGQAILVEDPAVPLIVELQIGGETVCAALTDPAGDYGESGIATSRRAGFFLLPWTALPNGTAGAKASLHIAGIRPPFTEFIIPDIAARRARSENEADHRYRAWLAEFRPFGASERLAAREYLATRETWPTISIILCATDGTSPDASIRSVIDQIYDDWELLVTGIAPTFADPRIRTLETAALRDAVLAARGGLVCLLQQGDLLAPDALLTLAAAALDTPTAAILYADEDEFDAMTGLRRRPHFKPAWGLDLHLHRNLLAHVALVAKPLLERCAYGEPDFAGASRTLTGAALSADGPVVHLPHILCHRPSQLNTGPELATAAFADALAEYAPGVHISTNAEGAARVIWPLPVPAPRISLVVPTRDRLDLLRTCIDGLLRDTDYPDLEVIIVDNDSVEIETLDYLKSVGRDSRVKILKWSGDFDFSAINNFAVEQATGSIIGLINNDLKIISPEWLIEMARHIVRPEVGVVGAKLLYADKSLQHAGIVLGIGTASHRYKGKARYFPGHGSHLRATHEVSAVTAACLLIRRAIWDEIEGLSSDFPVAYNDVDLCLKVRAAGYRILLEPRAMLFHLESQSRGSDKTDAKSARLAADRERLLARWASAMDDPFYSPNLSLVSTDADLAFPPRVRRVWDKNAALPTGERISTPVSDQSR